MAAEWFRTEQEQQILNAEIAARKQVRNLAEVLARHLEASGDPQAGVWSEALAWFAKRIKGGHLSILVQEGFDRRFGPVDWAALKAEAEDAQEVPDA